MRRIPVDPATVHRGLVENFYPDDGWGVITSPATPGGCWVHSSFVRDAFSLRDGQPVWFTFEPADQDGYAFRALHVWTNPDLIGQETNVHIRFWSKGSTLVVIPDEDALD